jgi:PAS domain S-box-containing protein
MKVKKTRQTGDVKLRRRAEERLDKPTAPALAVGAEEEPQRLLHELQVHQIELEMQNEELRRVRDVAESLLEKYKDLYDFAPVGYVTLDRQGTIRNVNLAGANLIGIRRSSLIGKRFGQLLADTFPPPFAEFLAKVFASRNKEAHDVSLLRTGNAPLCVRIEAMASGSGGECHLTLSNITDLKETETALRTSDERLKLALETSGMGVWEWDVQTNAVYWSPEVFKIFGADSNNGTLDSFTRAIHPEDVDRLRAAARQSLGEKTIFSMEFRIIRPDGHVRWLSGYARPVYDGKGDPLRLTGTVQDITERKQYEAEIRRLNTDLSAFNYMASHNLRRPLNNIFTSSEAITLLCGDRLDEESKSLLQIIKNGATNMSNLIGRLLTFSHSEHAELHRKKVDLGDMARVILAELRLNAPGRRVQSKIAEEVTVNCDPDLMRVALENLFDNAWKFTGSLEQAVIEFGVMEIGGGPAYFIRDNGPGFDMEDAACLFQPFRRLPGSDYTGHGIGLATVKRIIRRHGGKIWAEAEPGKGTTFFFTLGP